MWHSKKYNYQISFRKLDAIIDTKLINVTLQLEVCQLAVM